MSSPATKAILGAVALGCVALALVGPARVGHVAELGYQQQQALLAEQGAARVSATLGELNRRFRDPDLRRASGLDEARSNDQIRAALARLARDWDRDRGVHLLVHRHDGQIIATDAASHGDGHDDKLHVHRVRRDGEAAITDGAGYCDACLGHGGAISLVFELETELLLTVNVDTEALAGVALSEVLPDDSGMVRLVDSEGMELFATDPGRAPPPESLVARASMDELGVSWFVEISRSRQAIAPEVRSATRLILGIAALILLCAGAGLVSLRRAERRGYQERVERLKLLAHQDKLATLGLLSAATTHEIRNSLAAATLLSDHLRTQSTPEQKRDFSDLEHSLERLADIADRVTSFGRHDQTTSACVNEAVEEALALAEPALKNLSKVEICLDPDAPAVRGASGGLVQVILNLVVNAAHAGEHLSDHRISVVTGLVGDEVCVTVEDNGPGVPRALAPTLFEPYVSTKTEGRGTGLGLWISRQIVEDVGGTLSLETHAPEGARFSIRLPLAASA